MAENETMRVDLVLKSDRGTLGYEAAKGGKIRFTHSALDDGLTLDGREAIGMFLN
jgi:hypothetical protein